MTLFFCVFNIGDKKISFFLSTHSNYLQPYSCGLNKAFLMQCFFSLFFTLLLFRNIWTDILIRSLLLIVFLYSYFSLCFSFAYQSSILYIFIFAFGFLYTFLMMQWTKSRFRANEWKVERMIDKAEKLKEDIQRKFIMYHI